MAWQVQRRRVMTSSRTVRCSLFIPLVLATSSAWAAKPAAAVKPAGMAKTMRRAFGAATLGIAAAGAHAEGPADVATVGLDGAVTATQPAAYVWPNFAALANAQMRAEGIQQKKPAYQPISDRVQGGLLGMPHKYANEVYLNSPSGTLRSDVALVARFLTDSSQMHYGLNLKTRSFSVRYTHSW